MKNSELDFSEENEEESELDEASLKVSDAVVYSTDWTTETILSQLKQKNIDINPRFQRRDAWTRQRKSRFIESLILGLPIPQIVLAEKKDKRGKYLILDGKQRLLTLLQFSGAAEGKNNNFSLRGLEVRKDLNGKDYTDIEKDPDLQDYLHQFHNQPIRAVVIRNWPNLDFLHMVFVRLNTESVPLSPQELRQAAFPGEFVEYLDDAACESKSLKTLLKTDVPDFRMRDIELLLRFIAFEFYISDYSGNLKKFLDDTCDNLNKFWSEKQEEIKNSVKEFEKAIEAAIDIFGKDGVGKKWTGSDFEARINKAVLDVIIFYLSDNKIREAALKNKVHVLKSFQDLCVKNNDFRNSIETTTKSLSATYNRFSLWGNHLKRAINQNFEVPLFSNNNRINFSGFWK